MADSHDARLAELVTGLGGDEVRFLFRDLVQKALQELIDAELTEAIGARPHERTDTRTNQRNGGRTRVLSTPAGDVELRIPKVREGTFFPSSLEPRRRVDRALWAGNHDRLRHRHFHPQGRRPGQSVGSGVGDLEVDRVSDL